MIRLSLILSLLLPTAALAQEPVVPGAALTRSESSPADSVRLPQAPWSADTPAPEVEGAIRRQAFRIPGGSRTTLQLMDPIRERLLGEDYEEIFTCADAACGGFDFRFQLDILGEPDMHVDFGDYRYLLMRRDGKDPHTVSVVTSRSQAAGFLHITEISEAELDETVIATPPAHDRPAPVGDLIARLEAQGHIILDDLDFPSGSADLGAGTFASLESLATWLAETPSARIALVGHTDSVGSLDANTALSRRRAQSVSSRLVNDLGADAGRIEAQGAGYLAPIASNLTEEGRAANRRVEVVLLNRD